MLTDAVLAAASSAAGRLRARGESVAVAESSTGGLIAAALIAQDGASRYFRGGFVLHAGINGDTTLRRVRRRVARSRQPSSAMEAFAVQALALIAVAQT